MKKKGFILASVVAGVLGFFMGKKIADKKIENLEDQVNEEQNKLSKMKQKEIQIKNKIKEYQEKIKNIRA